MNCSTVLHFAPEAQQGPRVKAAVNQYQTADLSARKQMTHHVNIEAPGLRSCLCDRIICNPVIEPVDDAKALPEVVRMQVPGSGDHHDSDCRRLDHDR